MDPFTYYLAFSRMAPVQCVGWGHADTTGIPNVDYFVSSVEFETDGAQDQYSETLVCLPEINNYFEPFEGAVVPTSRKELGLPEGKTLYLCPQSTFKLHPDFDEALRLISERDPDAIIAISSGAEAHWTELLRARFERTIGRDRERIRFLPRVKPEQFRNLLAAADAILDPMYFTGGHTTYMAFSVGVPIVTWDGDHLRGRMTRGLYAQMGVEGIVAKDVADYAALATDVELRGRVAESIRENQHKLFRDVRAVRDFEEFLLSVIPK